jgi:mono/diheme cytochrome c family protein
MKYRYLLLLIAPLPMMFAADPYAEQLFQKNCASCHQAAAGAEARVPQIAALKTMTPAAILRTLESGIMKTQAAPLSGTNARRSRTF